jgi:hypothetical protein
LSRLWTTLPRDPLALLASFQGLGQRSFHLLPMLTVSFIAMNAILVVPEPSYGDSVYAFTERIIVGRHLGSLGSRAVRTPNKKNANSRSGPRTVRHSQLLDYLWYLTDNVPAVYVSTPLDTAPV